MTYDVEDGEEGDWEYQKELKASLDTAEITESVEVSLNSVVDLTAPKTMKIIGVLRDQAVVTLINPEATHNFISKDLMQKLGLLITKTAAYGITMGTGDSVFGEGICRGIDLHLQGVEILDDFLPLSLGSSNVILGIQWLETLGMTHTNWKQQMMKFQMGNKTVTLRGDPSLGKTMVSLKTMMKTLRHEGKGLLVELNKVRVEQKTVKDIPPLLQEVLGKFIVVFHTPMGLPPVRGQGHAIVLNNGTTPISVRPYRYPHFQKTKVEKLVSEMLVARIIQMGTSPFFFIGKENNILKRAEPQTGNPQEYTRSIQKGRIWHKRKAKTKNNQPTA